ncbi:MAG TPA: biopolymer transporter ExbD [Planctomycetaceae bacterium]|nr:biopolymer transporter ExbD [Planctomycetaceae bacterium]HRF02568.1 biopolymer transporter ExbD [Pirellulaceae bacterium]
MRIPSSGRRRLGINLTPMIDVVFQLIIFFLVSSQMAQQEQHLPLPLPEADSGSALSDETLPRLTINLQEDGSLSIGGRDVTADRLEELLTEAVSVKGSDVEVRIRASRRTPYRHAQELMLACSRVGIWNVTYAVHRRGEGER